MSKWLSHVKATMKANKGKKFGDVLEMASKTYKKGKMSGGNVMPHTDFGSGADLSYAGANNGSAFHVGDAAGVGGRRRSRRGRKSRRGTRRH